MPYLDKLDLLDAMYSTPASMSVCVNTDECFGMMRMKQMMFNLVSSFPEADVVPAQHGQWIEEEESNGDPYYICSVCNAEFVCVEGTPDENQYYYCPNCGARMDGDGE